MLVLKSILLILLKASDIGIKEVVMLHLLEKLENVGMSKIK